MDALKALMERTDQVHIVGPGARICASPIKGLPAIKCAGHMNILMGRFIPRRSGQHQGLIPLPCWKASPLPLRMEATYYLPGPRVA